MNTTSTRSRGLLALLLALAMVLGFSACGSTSGSSSNSSGSSTASNDSGNNNGTSGDTPTVTKGSNGKALIAYFSKTGTTQRAAEEIQKLTGADMFRIEPVQAYPEEYQRTTEIARDELNQNARTQVKGKVDDMAQYDTIFVGYPIWWMEPPMPVLTFLESYDLNGKTVIPFATSASSGIDGTLDMLRSSAKGANVTEGLRVTSNDEIQPWLQKIGVLK